jgi:hypothetical protein
MMFSTGKQQLEDLSFVTNYLHAFSIRVSLLSVLMHHDASIACLLLYEDHWHVWASLGSAMKAKQT